jgi:hypothetical protein
MLCVWPEGMHRAFGLCADSLLSVLLYLRPLPKAEVWAEVSEAEVAGTLKAR